MFDDDFDTRVSSEIELKAGALDDAGSLSGYLAAFGGPPDTHGDVIQPGAFAKTLREHKTAGFGLPMLWNHNTSQPIGRWSNLQEDDFGLKARGQLNLGTRRGQEAHRHIKAGDVTGLSIGFIAPASGQSRMGGVRTLHEVHLMEGSVTSLPSNARTRITEVKSIASPRELETLLRDGGLARAAAAKVAAVGWPALAGSLDHDALQQAAQRIARAAQSMRT